MSAVRLLHILFILSGLPFRLLRLCASASVLVQVPVRGTTRSSHHLPENVATILLISSADRSPASGVPGIKYLPISSPPMSTGS